MKPVGAIKVLERREVGISFEWPISKGFQKVDRQFMYLPPIKSVPTSTNTGIPSTKDMGLALQQAALLKFKLPLKLSNAMLKVEKELERRSSQFHPTSLGITTSLASWYVILLGRRGLAS